MECLGSYWISWKLEQKLFHLTYSCWNKTTAIFLNPVRILGSRGTKIVKLKMEARNGLTRIWIFMELMLSVNHLFNRLPLQELVHGVIPSRSIFFILLLFSLSLSKSGTHKSWIISTSVIRFTVYYLPTKIDYADYAHFIYDSNKDFFK